MSPEFREGEKVRECDLPCCECGKESNAHASFVEKDRNGDTQWLCKACCDANPAPPPVDSAAIAIATADGMLDS